MKRVKHSPDFQKGMIEFYKASPEASLDLAREHAKDLGYDTYSKNAHDRYRREAKRPAGELEIPEKVWMDAENGRFSTNFGVGTGGKKVAVFRKASVGRIKVVFPEE